MNNMSMKTFTLQGVIDKNEGIIPALLHYHFTCGKKGWLGLVHSGQSMQSDGQRDAGVHEIGARSFKRSLGSQSQSTITASHIGFLQQTKFRALFFLVKVAVCIT